MELPKLSIFTLSTQGQSRMALFLHFKFLHSFIVPVANGVLYVTGVFYNDFSHLRDDISGQWRGALMFSLIYVWINDWVNNAEAGDLRRHRAHYDVTVMSQTETEKLINLLLQFLYFPFFIFGPPYFKTGYY